MVRQENLCIVDSEIPLRGTYWYEISSGEELGEELPLMIGTSPETTLGTLSEDSERVSTGKPIAINSFLEKVTRLLCEKQ